MNCKKTLVLAIIPLLIFSGCTSKERVSQSNLGKVELKQDSSKGVIPKVMLEKYEDALVPDSFISGLKKYYNGEIKKNENNTVLAGDVYIDLTNKKRASVYYIQDETPNSTLYDYKNILKYTVVKTISLSDDQKIEFNSNLETVFDYLNDPMSKPNTSITYNNNISNGKKIYINASRGYSKGESSVIIEVY